MMDDMESCEAEVYPNLKEHVDEILKNCTLAQVYLENAACFMIESNLSILGQAILTLSRFSDQLHFEPTIDGLCIKAINSTKSAYASIFLTKIFFTESDTSMIHKDDYNLCRISMKTALSVFRPSISQHRDSNKSKLKCIIQLDPKSDYMIIKMAQVFHVAKCYVIQLRETADTYTHLFTDKDKLANCIKLHPRVLLDILTLVGSDNDMVKFVAMKDSFVLERFIMLEQDRSMKRKTSAVIDLDSFRLYSINRPIEVAIKVKELKAVLHFADGCGIGVSLHFEQPERPVIVSFEESNDFMAEFILATLDCGGTMLLGSEDLAMGSQAAQRSRRETTFARLIRDDEEEPELYGQSSAQPPMNSTLIDNRPNQAANFTAPLLEITMPLVEISQANWQSQPRTQVRDKRLGIFDLSQDTPQPKRRLLGKKIVCPESGDENHENI